MRYLSLRHLAVKFITATLSLCFLYSHGATKMLIKANVLKGVSFVTVDTDPKEVEDIFSKSLSKKGFEVVNTMVTNEDLLFVDLFVYQFFGQYPAITVTIRTKSGIHHVDQQYTRVFIDRNQANRHLASLLAERVPVDIDISRIHKVGISDILATNKRDPSSSAANALLNRPKYFSRMKWQDDDDVPFIIPGDLGIFLLYNSNYEGMGKQLRHGPIMLRLRINSSARFELVTIANALTLDDRQRTQIQDFVSSFPLWITDSEVDNIEIAYGIRSD
jgi:hypothetical protein